ncbi:hypothetical protein [Amycolatopsis sp. NPDC021455]|uniref:aggregation-promoting factor C-terminal-like domain-containing protein n=1 Tax=Amycolatopsis sp. NPDC021455 TaxID=3154901 RepID=UPI0033D35ED2
MAVRGGYDVGTAFLQVLPSFDNTQKAINTWVAKLRPIEIPARLDPNQLSAAVEDAARRAAKGTTIDLGKPRVDTSVVASELSRATRDLKVTAKVDLDSRQLDAKIREASAKNVAILAKLDLDESNVRARLAALDAETPKIGVDLDLNRAKLDADLAAIQARREKVEVDVEANTAKATADLAEVNQEADRLDGKKVNVQVESSEASRAIGIMALLTAGIAATGFAAPAAAAAIAAIGPAASAAGQGFTALFAAFNGVSDAVKAYQAVDDEAIGRATRNARQRITQTNAIASAQSSLASAQASADHTAISGAEQVQAARQSLARAEEQLSVTRETATRRVEDGERSLAAAQADARDSQLALNQAREEALQRIEDLKISLKGAALDEESASLALEKAQARLQVLKDAGVGPSTLEYREADLAARQAAQSVDEVRARYADLQKQSDHAAKTGVEGDKAVIAAHKAADAATVRVQDAERQLTQLRVDGAREVARSQEQVAASAQAVGQAQEHAAWANQAATKAVADAQRNLAEATQKAGEDGTAAMDKLHLVLSKLTPEGREFALFLQRDVKPALHDIGDAVQATLLPKMQTALAQLITLGPDVKTALTSTADVIGDLAIKGAEMVTSGPWRKDFATIARNNNKLIDTMGTTAFSLADALRSITVAAGPMLTNFAHIAAQGAAAFDAFIQGKRDSGELTRFFHDMGDRLKEIFTALKDVTVAVWDLANALGPLVGSGLIKAIDSIARLMDGFVSAHPIMTNVITIVGLVASAFIYLGRSVIGTVGAFRKGAQGFGLLTRPLRNARERLQEVADGTGRFADAADAIAHPVARMRQAAEDIAKDYTEGARRTREWIDAHSRMGLVGKALDAANDAATRLNTGTRSALGSLDTAASRAGQAFRTQLLPAIGSTVETITGKLAHASIVLGDSFETATATAARLGRSIGINIANGAEAGRRALGDLVGSFGSLRGGGDPLDGLAVGINRTLAGFDSLTRTAGRVRDAVEVGVVRASIDGNQALDAMGRGATRVRDALETGFIRACIDGNRALDGLGNAIQTGFMRAVIESNRALDAVGNTLSNSVLKPLINARDAYQETTSRLRDFDSVQQTVSGSLDRTGGFVTRLRGAFSDLANVTAGVGNAFRTGFAGPVEAMRTGLTNVASAAGGVANVIGTRVRSALIGPNGLLGVLGGPWGIAITGAVVGLGLLAQAHEDASQDAAAQADRERDLAAALRESNGVIDASVRKKAATALQNFKLHDGNRDLLEDARKLGISVHDLTDAYLGNDDAMGRIRKQLQDVVDRHSSATSAIGGLVAGLDHVRTAANGESVALDDTGFSAQQLLDILNGAGGTFAGAVQDNKNLAAALGETGASSDKVADSMTAAKTAADGFKEKLAGVADASKDVGEQGKAVIDFLDQLKGHAPDASDAADKINTDIRTLIEGFKDAKGNVVDFSQGFVAASGEIDTASQSGSDLRRVVRDLSADMAATGKAAFDQARDMGKSVPEAYQAAVDAMAPYLDKVKEALKQNGLTEKQINRLLDFYNLVPPDIATTILLSGDKTASSQVSDVLSSLKQLPPEVPVHVDALTGVAEEALIQLGYHIVRLPDGTFKVFSNTDIGQKQADDFVAHNDGTPITLELAVIYAKAQADLDAFKARNNSIELHPFITGSGKIGYTGVDGDTRILGTNLRMVNAIGRIIEFYAAGGFNQLNPMSASVAAVVPPNTMRVIGDRPVGDEAFIPINKSARSLAILMETAKRMGYALAPLARGALLAFAGGAVAAPGSVTTAPSSSSTPDASASADSLTSAADAAGALTAALGALQAATIAYTTTALAPQVDEIDKAVIPAVDALAAALTPLQTQYGVTNTTVTTTTAAMVAATATSVAQITGQLTILRAGLGQTGQAFQSTADWVNTSWSAMRGYAQAPTRDILTGPLNSGLIAAWNYLDASFGLNHHLAPVAIPFSEGGPVKGPGTGTSDSILARLSNGEYVLDADLTKRILPFLEALRGRKAEALQAAGYAQGGLVADTGSALNALVARAQVFAAAQRGKPYIWGGVGPQGYDCSGFMSALTNVLRGDFPYKRLGTAASEPWSGFVPGLSSAFSLGASPVHTAGTLGGVNAESTGDKVRFGPDAHGADDWQFTTQSSLPIAGGTFVSGGGTFDPAALVASAFTDTRAMVRDVLGRYPGNIMAQLGGGEVNYAADQLSKVAVDKVAVNTVAGGPAVEAAQNFARGALARFGWGQDQMAPLISLWNGESGWDYKALNKSSGAYGIAQALPAEKYGSVAPDWRTNPATQILWGLGYIKDRYGTPANAYSTWLSRSPHWYDDGGWLPPGMSVSGNHTGQPEAVLTPQQWQDIRTLAGLDRGGNRSITVNARTDASPEHIASVIDRRLAIGTRL